MATSGSTDNLPNRQETHRWVIPVALGLLAVYFVAAWGIDIVRRLPSDAHGSGAVVTFSGKTAYPTALAGVTGLGMRLTSPCFEGAIRSGDDRYQASSDALGQEPSYASSSSLVVATTVLAPADWLERLWTLPGVTRVDTRVVSSCFAIAGSPLGLVRAVPPAEQPAVLQFPAGTAYEDALMAVVGLGLRLADPCYEAALARGDHPAWHPASQQQAYAQSGSLVVAPTILTPSDWLTRLGRGVTPGPVLGCTSS